jgi:hypothetical protein
MRVHVDEGRPDVVRFEINCGQVGGCRCPCRFNRSDPLIVDEEVDKCSAVATAVFGPPGKKQIGTRACLIQ